MGAATPPNLGGEFFRLILTSSTSGVLRLEGGLETAMAGAYQTGAPRYCVKRLAEALLEHRTMKREDAVKIIRQAIQEKIANQKKR